MMKNSRYIWFLAAVLIFAGLVSVQSAHGEAIFWGRIDDPDGFTNVRKGPSVKSDVVMTMREGIKFLFEPSPTTSWWKLYADQNPPVFRGYIHKSRVRQLAELYTNVTSDSVDHPVTSFRDETRDLEYNVYPSNQNLFLLPDGSVVSQGGLIYDRDADRWNKFLPGDMQKAYITAVAPDGRILVKQDGYLASRDKGKTWTELPESDSCQVFPYRDGYIYTKKCNFQIDSTTHRRISRSLCVSTDMGQTWYENGRLGAGPWLRVDYEGNIYGGPFAYKDGKPFCRISVSRDKGVSWNPLVDFDGIDDMHMEVIPHQGRLYVNGCYGLLMSEDNGTNWKYCSSKSGDMLPEFICDITVAGEKVYVFDCSQVYISDLDMNNFVPHEIYTPLADWNWNDHYRWHSFCVNDNLVTPDGEIFVSRVEGVFHSTDGGQNFRQLAVDNTKLPGRAKCRHIVGDTVLIGTAMGLSISIDSGRTYRTLTTEQGMAENIVTSVYGDGNGFIVAAGTHGFAYSTDGGWNFSTYLSPTEGKGDGHPDPITLKGKGPNALMFGGTVGPHLLRKNEDGEYGLKKIPHEVRAGDMDAEGKLIITYGYHDGLLVSQNGVDGEWRPLADGQYNAVRLFENLIHINQEGAIYVVCYPRTFSQPRNDVARNNVLLCSYDQGRTWLAKDFSTREEINLFGFDGYGILRMRYRFEKNKSFDFQSRDYGSTWQFQRHF